MPPVLLAYGITAGAGALGALAYLTGFQLVGSMQAARERERENQERWRKRQADAQTAARLKKNAQARVRRAQKKQLAAATAEGGQLLVLNDANDLAVLDAPPKIQVQTTVPLVRATYFADPISQELTQRIGLHELREMVFAGVWMLTHHRDDPAPDRYDTAWSLATSDREAIEQLLKLAGIARDEARQLRLAWDQVGDPLTLTELLEARGFGKFLALTGEMLLPLTPLVQRRLAGL